MDSLTGPTISTIKRLFALSGNRCAFPKCKSSLIEGRTVVGKICHIKARNETGPRFDPNQTPEERHGYENLILLCGRHHDVIDDDEDAYTVDYLHRLKAKHEQSTIKLPEDETEEGAKLLFSNQSFTSIHQSGGVFAHTINIQNISSSQPPTDLAKSSIAGDKEPPVRTGTIALPKLNIIRRTEHVIFDHFRSSWRLAQQWEPESRAALVLWVENEFPVRGNGRDLPNLIASVRAAQYDSFTVSRAYWLQCRYNEVTLTSGGKLGVLIGHFFGRESFLSYCNPYPQPFMDIIGDSFHPLGEKTELPLIVRDSEAMPLSVIISIAQMPSQTVIACRQLTVTLPQLIVDMRECE